MVYFKSFLLWSFAFVCFKGIAQTGDSLNKSIQADARRIVKLDVQHIALDLKFDWEKKQAYGTATITLTTLFQSDKIALDAGMLIIDNIQLPGGKKLQYTYDGGDTDGGLVIFLDRFYKAGESVTIQVAYRTGWVNNSDPNALGGSFGKGIRFIQPASTAPTKRKQIWSIGEAQVNRYWFPSYDVPGDLRTTEFTATIDKRLMAISNGKLVSVKDNPDGSHSYHYKAATPYPNYLTAFVIGEYTDIQQQYDGISLHTFCYPDEVAAAKATVERLPDMVKFFSTVTGAKYPYASYSQVMVQDYPFPGLTGQHTLSIISDNMIDDDRTHRDFFYLWDGVEANALAGQWFGNLVAVNDWSETWLTKSFANYLDGLYSEYKNGRDEYLLYNFAGFDLPATLGDWNNGYRHPIVTTQYPNTENFVGDNYAKSRGALVLRMLGKEVGEEVWKKTIKHFVANSAGKRVTTKDLQKSVETVSGKKMDWFFDQWIYKMGHPIFEVTKNYDPVKKTLHISLKQTQQFSPDSLYRTAEYFRGKMEIEIDGRIQPVTLEAKKENEFAFTLLQKPKLVNVNFEHTWISEMTFVKSPEEWICQFQYSKDIIARQTAMNELAKTMKNEATSPADKEKIIGVFANVIKGKSYWRLRSSALTNLMSFVQQPYDNATTELLQQLIRQEKSWMRSAAVTALGNSKDKRFADVYIRLFNDPSDRVIMAAASALGKSKSDLAFDALVELKSKASWKSQSLMASLTGLRQLGDPRGAAIALQALTDIQSPRWFLGNSGWDYPVYAAQTLAALGKGNLGYPIVQERLKKSLEENDIGEIFNQLLLVSILADPAGREIFELLKTRFKDDANAMTAIGQYEEQFKAALKI